MVTAALQPPRPKHYARTTLRRHVTVPVPLEYAAELAATALALVAPGKGVLSIDESLPTLKERFERAGIELADDGDLTQYRELVVTAPDLGTYASGCVLLCGNQTVSYVGDDVASIAWGVRNLIST